MAQKGNEQNVYTFSNVALTLDSKRYNIAGIVFILAENGIPDVTVTVDPAHKLGDPTVPAISTTLTLIKQLNDTFQAAAIQRKKATLTFSWASTGGESYGVELKDWICTSAGFSPVSTSGGVGLKLTISHPVAVLNGTSIVLGNITGSTSSLYSFATGNNILEVVKRVLDRYRVVKRMEKSPVPSITCSTADMPTEQRVMRFLMERIRTASAAITDTLKWTGPAGNNAWPFGYCASELVKYIKYSLVDELCAGMAFNIWDLFIQQLFPAFSLSLIPTWTQQKLEVKPADYWGNPKMFVDEWEINSVALPPTDPQPVAGVMFLHGTYTPQGGEESLIDQSTFQMRSYSQMAYVPDMFLKDPKMFGRVIMANPPFWFTRAIQLAQDPKANSLPGKELTGNTSGMANSSPQEATLTPSSTFQFSEAKYKALLRAYARALFQMVFRRGMQIRLTTKLMINHKDSTMTDKLFVPGGVCRIRTTDGKQFYDFYVTHVVHVLDVAGNNAHTEIGGMFVRTEKQYGGIVQTGIPNVLYSSVGAVEKKGATPEAIDSSLSGGTPADTLTAGSGSDTPESGGSTIEPSEIAIATPSGGISVVPNTPTAGTGSGTNATPGSSPVPSPSTPASALTAAGGAAAGGSAAGGSLPTGGNAPDTAQSAPNRSEWARISAENANTGLAAQRRAAMASANIPEGV